MYVPSGEYIPLNANFWATETIESFIVFVEKTEFSSCQKRKLVCLWICQTIGQAAEKKIILLLLWYMGGFVSNLRALVH